MLWRDVLKDQIALVSKDNIRREYIPRTKQIDAILDQLSKDRAKVFSWSHHSTSRLTKWLTECMADVGIDKRGRNFHAFRKSRWSDLIEKNTNPSIAAKLMRCSIQTAQKHYIHHSMKDLREAAEK